MSFPSRDVSPLAVTIQTRPHQANSNAAIEGRDRVSQDISQRASAAVQQGMKLTARRAYYSARGEFIQALRIIAQARDSQSGEPTHSRALSAALRALREAKDFVPPSSKAAPDFDVGVFVASHRTPVLKGIDSRMVTPVVALQRYYGYAQEQLVRAVGAEPVASDALFALGKLSLLIDSSQSSAWMGGPTAMAFFQAALVVNPSNWAASNELGVLMARYGQLQDARRVLLASLSIRATPQAWYNLSVVHRRLGEVDLAARAEHEWQMTRGSLGSAANALSVEWVEPSQFTQTRSAWDNPGDTEPRRTSPVDPAPMARQKKDRSASQMLFSPFRR